MKKIIIAGIAWVLFSCNQPNNSVDAKKGDKNVKSDTLDYDSYSFDIVLGNRNVLYFNIEAKSDSLRFVKQSFKDTITSRYMIKLTQNEIIEMKQTILDNLKLSVLDNSSSITFEGQSASFRVKKRSTSITSKFTQLNSVENISPAFSNFLKKLRD